MCSSVLVANAVDVDIALLVQDYLTELQSDIRAHAAFKKTDNISG
jgi:hypothetical protein